MEGAKDDLPRPVVTFFPPHSTQELVLFSLFEGDESALQKFLPKSHLTNVIIHDNISVQRVQEIKIKDLDNSQRKTGNHYEHLKKRFLHDQRNKMNRWKQQYSRYQRMLEKIDQRAMRQATLMYPGQYSLQLQMALLKNR
ncbi:uncharacterized protein C5orf52 homolog [Sphaerodactylus townsendi]|uniref:Uncharacterized protein n=1 Tax=Sphaerodactylus townsendi TaxID=933632 RepID=A0ACB8FZP0_9SAUR|nr:uncharacterized protein C5orf52 homolog [Sphaerodactylus townsendi]